MDLTAINKVAAIGQSNITPQKGSNQGKINSFDELFKAAIKSDKHQVDGGHCAPVATGNSPDSASMFDQGGWSDIGSAGQGQGADRP